jgi:hypothetical protein
MLLFVVLSSPHGDQGRVQPCGCDPAHCVQIQHSTLTTRQSTATLQHGLSFAVLQPKAQLHGSSRMSTTEEIQDNKAQQQTYTPAKEPLL